MAFLHSSILKSERGWMTAVIKPWCEKKGEKEKQRKKIILPINSDRSILDLRVFSRWCCGLSLPFLLNWIKSVPRHCDSPALSRLSNVFLKLSRPSTGSHSYEHASKKTLASWGMCALKIVNPTPTIRRRTVPRRYALNKMDASFTLCTQAAQMLSPGSLFHPKRAVHKCRDWLCKIWGRFFMQASVLLHRFPL